RAGSELPVVSCGRPGRLDSVIVRPLDDGRLPARPMSESLPHDLPPLITWYRRRKALGTMLAVVVLTGMLGTTWFFFVRAPAPDSVCDHVAAMRRRFPQETQALQDAVAPLTMSGSPRAVTHSADQLCTWFFTTEQRQRSFLDYGRLARCVTFAESPQELYPCLR
ncbi:MAG: hypothetical protein KDK70_36760, partial [Myxococcales bacterium]|nr:hypothetical protein [Myxococcales bacterium]